MAVYTYLSDSQISDLLTYYDIGSFVSAQPIAEGVENSNYLITTSDDRFILTLYEKRVDSNDLPFFLGLKQNLSGSGIKCPNVINRLDGKFISEAGDRKAAIISFMSGGSVFDPNLAQLNDLGKAIARMHSASSRFDLSRQNNLSPNNLLPLFIRVENKLNELAPNLQEQLHMAVNSMQIWDNMDLPKGIIHADLFPDNVFFIGDELTGIIDFYFACTDYFAYDLAIVMNAWCFDNIVGDFNKSKAKALFDGYQQVRKLQDSEISAMPILAKGASLRFLLTRANDWLFPTQGAVVTPHDPAEYIKKWQFHCSVESSKEYGI